MVVEINIAIIGNGKISGRIVHLNQFFQDKRLCWQIGSKIRVLFPGSISELDSCDKNKKSQDYKCYNL
jgi:hypothetical protein